LVLPKRKLDTGLVYRYRRLFEIQTVRDAIVATSKHSLMTNILNIILIFPPIKSFSESLPITISFRGRVKLHSLEPEDLPLVYSNYFSHPDDYKPFLEAMKFNKAFAAALVRYNATMFDEADPVCSKYEQGT